MLRFKALLFLILISSMGIAQTDGDDPMFLPNDNYIVNQYNSENGLPQNSAKDLLLDRNGFLWITTEDGLVRFDGRQFRVYNMSNAPFLRTNRFSIISESSRREVLFTSGFDPSVIYKAMPDYRLMIDSHATGLRHKLISYHSNGIFDLAPLFGYNTKHNVPPVDTLLLNSITERLPTAALNTSHLWSRRQSGLARSTRDFFAYTIK